MDAFTNIYTDRVIAAMLNLKNNLPDYYEKTMKSRCDTKERNGSYYTDIKTPEELFNFFRMLPWVKAVNCPNVVAFGCEAYMAIHPDVEGRLGIIDLGEVPMGTKVTIKDPKNTGKCQCYIKEEDIRKYNSKYEMPTSVFSIAIIGEEDGIDGDVLFTIHPGFPIKPSVVEYKGDTEVKVMDIMSKFKYAKVEQ